MRIAINALGAFIGGSQTYYVGLLPALAEVDRDNEYLLLRAPWQDYLPPAPAGNFRWIDCPMQHRSLARRIVYEQVGLPSFLRRHRVDVLYSPAEMTTLAAPCRVVLALRNLSAYALRWRLGFAYWRRSMVLGEMARLSAWRADRVIFVSDTSRRIIARKLLLPLKKTDVVHHGLHPSFHPSHGRSDAAPSPRVRRPYLLSVSQIRRAKNYTRLVEAFARIVRTGEHDFDLVILGSVEDAEEGREIGRVIDRHGLQDRVHLPGAVPYHELPAWYGGARLFVFPSLLETFGHPLVEAMASGVPVLASNAPAIPEIVGDAALLFDPWSIDSIEHAIKRVLGDEALAKDLGRRSLERAREFSWVRTAEKTRHILESVGGAPGSLGRG